MKDLYTEIHDLYKEGMKPVHIATKLNIPLYMVSGALAMQASPKEMKYFDGQPVMNERIKELAEQAGYLPDNFGIGHWDMPECKRFAELIIQECVNQAHGVADLRGVNDDMVYGADTAAVRIHRYFGVEK